MDRRSPADPPADITGLRQQLQTLRQTVTTLEALLERYATSEQALRASEEQFRLLVTSVRDYAIFMLDPEGHIVSWNTGAQLIKGYAAAEILGQHFSIFYPPADLAAGKPTRELEIAVREGVYQEEGWRVRKDGSLFWASVVITALFDADGTLQGFGKVTRDLTERKRADDAQQQLRAQELQLTRMELAREQAEANVRLRDAFLSETAHELRTPVTAVLGFAELLQRRLDRAEFTPERVAKPVQAVILQAQRLNRLTTLLLDLPRLEQGKRVLARVPMELDHAVAQVAHELQLLSERHTIALDLPTLPVIIEGDTLRVEQVIYNLVQNAIKYSPAGSSITVALCADGPDAVLTVRDAGMGIPAADLPHVFDRFYRATNSVSASISGFGIGLSLVKEVVELHGGTVTVQSSVGQGTTVRVALPRSG